MRQVVSFVVASSLFAAGSYLLYLEAFEARVWLSKVIAAGAFLVFLGGGWLWADFIAPMLGRKVDF